MSPSCHSHDILLRSISFHSIAAPPTTAARPPATAQSGASMAAAADLVEAVLAELEVAVLVLELVLEEVVAGSR